MEILTIIAIIFAVLLVYVFCANEVMQSTRDNGPHKPVDWKHSQEDVLATIIENLHVLEIYNLEIHQRSDLEVNWSVIKKQYRKLSLQYHPDRNEGDQEKMEMFKKITGAYAILEAIYKEDTFKDIDDLSAALRFFNAHMEGHC